MDYQLIGTIVIITLAMIGFATEAFRVDLIALSALLLLVVIGVIEPERAFSGFANSATLTVAAMFILSDALIRTGIIPLIAPAITRLFSKSYSLALLGMGTGVGVTSAFINNTPVVATLIPIVSKAAKKVKMKPIKFLIPLSYGAILGGTCTLIGTSTNLLVSGIAENEGISSIGLFTMSPIGLIFSGVGMLYLTTIGKYLLPDSDQTEPLEDDEEIESFLTEVVITNVEKEQDLDLKTLFDQKDLSVEVESLKRDDTIIEDPEMGESLHNGDVLLIKGSMEKVKQVVSDDNLHVVESIKDSKFPEQETKIIEIIVMPGNPLIDRRLESIDFLKRYQSNILAVKQRGKRKFKNLKKLRLKVGDVLLLQTNKEGFDLLKQAESDPNAPFLSVRESSVKIPSRRKMYATIAILLAAILSAALNILPIVISAWLAVVLLAMLRIINLTDAYKSIDWQVVFLLVGSLSFGEAMKASGLSEIIAGQIEVLASGDAGPYIIIGVIYLTTMVFTEIMSNNAAAALMAPISIAVASMIDINALPLLLAVMLAGSSSFMTPIGYQTNTMVYSAGNYRFSDFFKVGVPLNLLFLILATLLIPLIYPF